MSLTQRDILNKEILGLKYSNLILFERMNLFETVIEQKFGNDVLDQVSQVVDDPSMDGIGHGISEDASQSTKNGVHAKNLRQRRSTEQSTSQSAAKKSKAAMTVITPVKEEESDSDWSGSEEKKRKLRSKASTSKAKAKRSTKLNVETLAKSSNVEVPKKRGRPPRNSTNLREKQCAAPEVEIPNNNSVAPLKPNIGGVGPIKSNHSNFGPMKSNNSGGRPLKPKQPNNSGGGMHYLPNY